MAKPVMRLRVKKNQLAEGGTKALADLPHANGRKQCQRHDPLRVLGLLSDVDRSIKSSVDVARVDQSERGDDEGSPSGVVLESGPDELVGVVRWRA